MIRGAPIRLAANGQALPTSFRLFRSGWNSTEQGRFLFDDKAAQSVMAAYRAWGVDVAIDLEHQMFDEPGADPTARDARGWCRLELRNGELWACDVKWTPDGAKRLQQKTQRYISPAFETDSKTKRITKVVNMAITALPASHGAPALVAASARKGGTSQMDGNVIKEALEAIASGDGGSALQILKELLAGAASDGSRAADEEMSYESDDPTVGDEDGSEGSGAEGVAPPRQIKKPKKQKAIDPKVVESRLTAKQLELCRQYRITPATFVAASRALNRPLPRTLG